MSFRYREPYIRYGNWGWWDSLKAIGLVIFAAICLAIPPLIFIYFLVIILSRNSNQDSEADKLKKRYKLTNSEVVDMILNKKTVEQIYTERDISQKKDVTIRNKIKPKFPVPINQKKWAPKLRGCNLFGSKDIMDR